MSEPRKLVMTISLNALEHLGINLYSNIPAVLSEVVANAWDADAKKVSVTIDKAAETIVIEDDGTGMDRDGVIDRFLTVGYKRRDELGETTASGRKPMGRKGIGKLSIFSIAQVADIYTTLNNERTAFQMDRDVIRKAIAGKGQVAYEPDELTDWPSDLNKGTRIVLSKISKSLSGMTVEGLRAGFKSSRWFAMSCDASREHADAGDVSEGGRAFDGFLPVLCEAAAAS